MAEQPFFRSSTSTRRNAALSFGGVAAAYDRGRPDYPPNSVVWLVGTVPGRVLELGAGTGKLTRSLVALGHDVFATDPDQDMLDILAERVPEASLSRAHAEEIPLPDECMDVIVVAQAFHWFDFEAALPEIARVLGAGGQLSLVWNERDERIPWVKRLGKIIGSPKQLSDPTEILEASGLFGPVESKQFPHWQKVNRETIVDLVLSRSAVATMSAENRATKVAEVLAFYDSYGRGMDGMRLPYVTTCYRCEVLEPPVVELEELTDETRDPESDWLGDLGPAQAAGDELLIDLH